MIHGTEDNPGVPSEVLDIPVPDGRHLRVVVRRASPARGVLILLPAGLKYSVGPHRLNQKLAREVADLGLMAAFVDPGGYGDSEGSPLAGATSEVWRSIESGVLVDDILAATRTLRSRYPGVPFYISGLCGGAVTAFLAAARAPDLFAGVISFSLAVQVTSIGSAAKPIRSPTFARNLLGAYAQRAFSAAAWGRLFRGEAKLTGPLHAFSAAALHLLRPATTHTIPGLNSELCQALRKLAAHQMPQLMVFGGSDRRHHEFIDASPRGLWGGDSVPDVCRIETVPHANHEFHFREWQIAAFQVVREWVSLRLAGAPSGHP